MAEEKITWPQKYLLHLNGEFVVEEAFGVSKEGYLLDDKGLPLINPTMEHAETIASIVADRAPPIFRGDEHEPYFLKQPSNIATAQKLQDGNFNLTKDDATYLINNSKYLYDNGYHSLIRALYRFVPENPLWDNEIYQRNAEYDEFHNAVVAGDVEAIMPFKQRHRLLPGSALNTDGFLVLQDAAVKHNNDILYAVSDAFRGRPYFKSMLKKVIVAAVASNNIELVDRTLGYARNLQSRNYSNFAESLVSSLGILEFATAHGFNEIHDIAAKYAADSEGVSKPAEIKEFFLKKNELEVQPRELITEQMLEFPKYEGAKADCPIAPPHPKFSKEVFDKIYPMMKFAYELEGRAEHYGVEAAYKMAVLFDTEEAAKEGVVGILHGYASRGIGSLLIFSLPDDNNWSPEVWREPLKEYGKSATPVVEEAAFIERIVNSRPDDYDLAVVVEKCCADGSAKSFYAVEAEKRIRIDLPPEFNRSPWLKLNEKNPKMVLTALDNNAFEHIKELNDLRREFDQDKVEPDYLTPDDVKMLYLLSVMEKSPELKENPKLRKLLGSIITGHIDSGGLEVIKSPNTLGVELEYHGIKRENQEVLNVLIQLMQDGWKQTLDSSIVPEDGSLGLETVSPILKDQGVKFVNPIVQVIQSLGGEVSGACALHVHAGIKKSFADEQTQLSVVKQAIINYVALEEKGELKFLGENNKLTYPYHKIFYERNKQVSEAINEIINAENFEQLMVITQPEGRRRASINLHPLLTYGTIEFRQHPGSTEPSEVTAWVKFVDNFMHESIQMALGSGGVHKPSAIEQQKLEKLVKNYKMDRSSQDISEKCSILEARHPEGLQPTRMVG